LKSETLRYVRDDRLNHLPCYKLLVPGRVVHCKHGEPHAYVGRPTLLGNPYGISRHARFHTQSREESINCFRVYAVERMANDPEFRKAILMCHGQVLGCWCHPKDCHAWVILELAHLLYLLGEQP
jgi:hypothetical protein